MAFPLKTVEYYGDVVPEETMGIAVEPVVRQLGLVGSSPSRFVAVAVVVLVLVLFLGGVRSYTLRYTDADTETPGAQGGYEAEPGVQVLAFDCLR